MTKRQKDRRALAVNYTARCKPERTVSRAATQRSGYQGEEPKSSSAPDSCCHRRMTGSGHAALPLTASRSCSQQMNNSELPPH